jgi:FlaA1/EpsC-like NDP-sugar epimerase
MALQYSDIRTSPVPLPIGKELQEVTTAELPSELSELGSEERSVAPVITMKSDQVEEILLQKHLGQTLLSRPNHTLRGFSLKGNVCVVTGGASGIGLEICRFLLESGGRVAIVDLNGKYFDAYMTTYANHGYSIVGAAERQAKLLTQSFDSEDENNL